MALPALVFCDTSFFYACLGRDLDHAPCFTFDEDFRRLGLTVLP